MIILNEAQLARPQYACDSAPSESPYADVFLGRRILIVEDSPDNQVLITAFLRPTGAIMTLAVDGLDGVEKARATPFDLILMDIQMPQLDGHQALRKLREMGITQPVVAMTAHAMREERQRCSQSGFSAYVSKPLSRRLLIETMLSLTV